MVRRRRMVRSYTDAPVDPAVVERALRHAVRAPNAGFTQGWGFLVLDTPADVRRFWVATSPGGAADLERPSRWLAGMSRAPVLVVPCSSRQAYLARYAEPDKDSTAGTGPSAEERWPVPYWHTDAAMAGLLVLQTAVDEGLGACLFGIPADRLPAFRAEFGVPEEFAPVGAITVGHPAPGGPTGSPGRRPRRPMGEVVHRGAWS